MSSLGEASSPIKDVLLTTPVGQAGCLFQKGLARILFWRNAKEPLQAKPDLECQSSSYTLTKESILSINQLDKVSAEQSQMEGTSAKLAEGWPMAKRLYTSVVICLYT